MNPTKARGLDSDTFAEMFPRTASKAPEPGPEYANRTAPVANVAIGPYVAEDGSVRWMAEYSQPIAGRLVPRCIRHTATTPDAALRKVATTLGKVGIQ